MFRKIVLHHNDKILEVRLYFLGVLMYKYKYKKVSFDYK